MNLTNVMFWTGLALGFGYVVRTYFFYVENRKLIKIGEGLEKKERLWPTLVLSVLSFLLCWLASNSEPFIVGNSKNVKDELVAPKFEVVDPSRKIEKELDSLKQQLDSIKEVIWYDSLKNIRKFSLQDDSDPVIRTRKTKPN